MWNKKQRETEQKYLALNAQSKLILNGKNNFAKDIEAANIYTKYALTKTMKFNSVDERINYLINNDYYESAILKQYTIEQIENLTNTAHSFKFKFPSFMGAMKFYNAYCLKTFDGNWYLEQYEDRVVMNALLLAGGDFSRAQKILKQIMLGRFQPATPTFLNAGKKQRGEYVSCYLLRVEDNMESISRTIASSLQLSKRGGGVALSLTNIREFGSPIKKIQNQSTGIIPIMKILEDSFSYANQLGQRQGAGAVYLNAHHPEILSFLDTKRENADEKIRIKSLSLGIVIPNITFELARNNEEMALFSPYDVEKVYKKPLSDISITKEYGNMIANSKIKKTYINARKLFQLIAELHFESGYPYLLFDDTVNNNNPYKNRIVMSNLCSEIVQPNTPSEYDTDLSYKKIGEDVCCNLGSVNIHKIMQSGKDFSESIYQSILALDYISWNSSFDSVPSLKKGNNANHAIGLGAMNLHGFLSINHIYYDSLEAIDFTNMFFYTMAYYAYKASNRIAKDRGYTFANFKGSKYEDGTYFDKYTKSNFDKWTPATQRVVNLFKKYNVKIPSQKEWIELAKQIQKFGLANSHLMAIAPTGSISYLSSCTPSLQPVVSPVEIRKEGKIGRVYFPSYKIDNQNIKFYNRGAYEVGPFAIIDIVAAAQQHIDQAISLTLFMTDKVTTRDLNKAYIYAFKKKCSSIYYVRVRQEVLEGSESIECSSCFI